MRIGILGSGLMGCKLGTLFARAGHEVIFSYARSEQKLKMLARDVKGKASSGTPREAVQDIDAVLLAVHWSRIDDARNEVSEWLREIGMIEELKPQTNFKSSTSAEDLLQQTSSSDLFFGFRALGGWLGL